MWLPCVNVIQYWVWTPISGCRQPLTLMITVETVKLTCSNYCCLVLNLTAATWLTCPYKAMDPPIIGCNSGDQKALIARDSIESRVAEQETYHTFLYTLMEVLPVVYYLRPSTLITHLLAKEQKRTKTTTMRYGVIGHWSQAKKTVVYKLKLPQESSKIPQGSYIQTRLWLLHSHIITVRTLAVVASIIILLEACLRDNPSTDFGQWPAML